MTSYSVYRSTQTHTCKHIYTHICICLYLCVLKNTFHRTYSENMYCSQSYSLCKPYWCFLLIWFAFSLSISLSLSLSVYLSRNIDICYISRLYTRIHTHGARRNVCLCKGDCIWKIHSRLRHSLLKKWLWIMKKYFAIDEYIWPKNDKTGLMKLKLKIENRQRHQKKAVKKRLISSHNEIQKKKWFRNSFSSKIF